MAGCYKNTSVGATFTITDIIWTLLNRCPANVRASPVRKDTPISVRESQTPQSSQVAANIDSSILAEDLSKRLCVIVLSYRGHHVLAVLSTRVEKRCMFFHSCSGKRRK
ncbi:hypothetical protein ABG768_002046 [Culter alburnus]|uniref:Uncharacterized protein n=1 Tax=Culter alburnus TaxID=194366 RepID=A0AAW2A2M2_CULAL